MCVRTTEACQGLAAYSSSASASYSSRRETKDEKLQPRSAAVSKG